MDAGQSVYSRLLEAGEKEFFERGYEKASLRKICARAGVTTGALYFTFQDKADLFEHVVRDTVSGLQKLSREMIAHELEDASAGVDNEKYLLEFLWKRRETVIILFRRAAGTPYENYWEDMQKGMEQVFAMFFRAYGVKEPDAELLRILVRMKMMGYMELLSGGYSLEQTLRLAEQVGWYTEGGFECLLEKLKQGM